MKTKSESFILSKAREFERWMGFQTEVKWTAAMIVLAYHVLAVYWCYYYAFPVKWQTVIFAYVMFIFSGFGITGGVHRYWTHKTFKAATPLRLILMVAYASAAHASIYQWVRNHRVHHKFSDTDSDPHNINRGLFFSHVGWLLMKRRPEVVDKCNKIDMTDIENDPIATFHSKYINIINPLACWVVPTLLAIFLLGESWKVAVAWQCFIRLLCVYNVEFAVNSLAHCPSMGYRPYNKNIMPVNSALVSAVTGGEGWHNYHHAFPFDYRASELGHFLNQTTALLHLAERFGWLTDKKQASPEMIQNYIERHNKVRDIINSEIEQKLS